MPQNLKKLKLDIFFKLCGLLRIYELYKWKKNTFFLPSVIQINKENKFSKFLPLPLKSGSNEKIHIIVLILYSFLFVYLWEARADIRDFFRWPFWRITRTTFKKMKMKVVFTWPGIFWTVFIFFKNLVITGWHNVG